VEFGKIYPDPEKKAALKQGLGLPMVSFPAVFVRGAFLGSFEQLQEVISTDRLNTALAAPMVNFPAINVMPDPVQLFVGPRGQPWFHFQLHVYANIVRFASVLHVALFGLVLALAKAAPVVSTGILCVLAVDFLMFALFGATPLAPLMNLVTIFVWPFRGNAVTSLPYKFVIGVMYFYQCMNVLTCGHPFGGPIYQVDQCPMECGENKDEDCSILTLRIGAIFTNSILLAFFRF